MSYLMDRDGDTIVLHLPATAAAWAKEIPGHRYDSSIRAWRFPLSWATCVVARGVLGDELEVGRELALWAIPVRDQIQDVLDIRAGEPVLDKFEPVEGLYPYQQQGVHFLTAAGSALLADDMGTGKTVQMIAALELQGAYPALIVCPTSVKKMWGRQFAAWAPGRRVTVAPSGTARASEAAMEVANGGADVLVVGWEALRGLTRLAPFGSLRLESCSNCDATSRRSPATCEREEKVLNGVRWSAVVADEAHRAKDPKAKQTRALWALGDKADHRYALTGTPVANDASDLWSVMRFVAPLEYPAKTAWLQRYALTVPNFFSGGIDIVGMREDTRPELDRYFLPRFLRRTKAEVLPDLPPKVYERREVELKGKQLKAYQQMEREMMAELAEGSTVVATNSLTNALRLRQLACAYGEVVSQQGWGLSAADPHVMQTIDQQVKLAEPSSKLDELGRVLEDLGGRQAVVFAESRQLLELAEERFKDEYSIVMLVGGSDQDAAVEAFNNRTAQLVFATVGAGGEGVDGLQVSDVCIFLQRPYSAVLNKQAEDRLHRAGQTSDKVTYVDLVTVDTVETEVFEKLRLKEEKFQDVVRDEEAVRA